MYQKFEDLWEQAKIGTLLEVGEFEKEFNRAWPHDFIWEDL